MYTTYLIYTWWWLIPHRGGFLEGWRSVLACLFVTVESDSWCAHPATFWTGEGLGWGFAARSFLPPASFLCGFMPLCLELTTGFSHWWAPAVSTWGILLPWLMADSRLCKLSLQLVFVKLSWSVMITLSFLELAEQNCFGNAYVFHPWEVTSPAQLHLKQDGLYAGFLEDFFVWHVVLPFDAKDGEQATLMNRSNILIYFL